MNGLGLLFVTTCKYRMVGNLFFNFMLDPTGSVMNDAASVYPGMRYLTLQEKNTFPSPAHCLKFIREERLPCK